MVETWVEKWIEKLVENGRRPVGMSRGPTSEVEKIKNIWFIQKLIKLHEMTGNVNPRKGSLKSKNLKKASLEAGSGIWNQ